MLRRAIRSEQRLRSATRTDGHAKRDEDGQKEKAEDDLNVNNIDTHSG